MRVRAPKTDTFGMNRYVVAVFPPAAESKRSGERRRIQDIQLAETEINQMLRESIRALQVVAVGRVPTINVYVHSAYRRSMRVSEGFNTSLFKRPDELRAGVFLVDVEDDPPACPTEMDVPYSHFVRITFSPGPRGWFVGDPLSYAIVRTTPAAFACLVHDVALDIAMFHSYGSLAATWGTSIAGRREFSIRKVAFAKRLNLRTFYGPILDWRLRYFSFAAACRTKCIPLESFQVAEYSSLWDRFIVDSLLVDPTPSESTPGQRRVPGRVHRRPEGVRKLERRAPVSELTRYHRFAGQLPKARILAELQLRDASEGPFFLVIPQRRPPTTKERTAVASFFRRERWRRGLFRIISATEFSTLSSQPAYKRWDGAAYLSIFKFTLP
jgi:hypothetical protein